MAAMDPWDLDERAEEGLLPPEALLDAATAVRIEQLGWTSEDAAAVRASLAVFAPAWDHPAMAVYDAL